MNPFSRSPLSEAIRVARERWRRRRSTEDVFTKIYAEKLWGSDGRDFCSGPGSHAEHVVTPYVSRMRELLREVGAERLCVVDLGCGDFHVGHQLADLCGYYVGVDVVKPLVDRNTASFGTSRIEFRHLDMIRHVLPDGDICFVRQVFQHLSNRQISAILPKLESYRSSFITEHHPSAKRFVRANLDKLPGGDTRLENGSGVFLDEPPFSVPKHRLKLILEVDASLGSDEGVIRTFAMIRDPLEGFASI